MITLDHNQNVDDLNTNEINVHIPKKWHCRTTGANIAIEAKAKALIRKINITKSKNLNKKESQKKYIQAISLYIKSYHTFLNTDGADFSNADSPTVREYIYCFAVKIANITNIEVDVIFDIWNEMELKYLTI